MYISIYGLKNTHNLLKSQIFLFFSEALFIKSAIIKIATIFIRITVKDSNKIERIRIYKLK